MSREAPSNRIQTASEILSELRAQRHAWESGVRSASTPVIDAAQSPERGATIAVLPFANMSADKENEYFGDGLAEELINTLAQVPGLRVAGRTSSFVFRGKDIDLQEVGRRLNVEHLLEGSVRRAGNRIRVTAQLIKVADGFHLWSERFDRELTDIFAIQDEVTHAIASALRINCRQIRRRRDDTRRTFARMRSTSRLETSGIRPCRDRSYRSKPCSSTQSQSILSSRFRTAC